MEGLGTLPHGTIPKEQVELGTIAVRHVSSGANTADRLTKCHGGLARILESRLLRIAGTSDN
jgi:hypothetical protein